MNIVDKIRALCSERTITIAELERNLGLGAGTVSRWDARVPGIDKVQKVAEYFDVSTDYLLGRTDNPAIAGDSKEYIWQGKTLNVEEMASNVMMFGGRELTDEKKKIIQSIIEGYLKEAGD